VYQRVIETKEKYRKVDENKRTVVEENCEEIWKREWYCGCGSADSA